MKTELTRYEANQIYLLKDGTIVLITDADPLTKINNTEKTRRCYCKLGHTYKKGEQFSNQYMMVIENDPTSSVISIDISQNKTFTIKELREQEAYYIGKVTNEKMEEYKKISSDYQSNNRW